MKRSTTKRTNDKVWSDAKNIIFNVENEAQTIW